MVCPVPLDSLPTCEAKATFIPIIILMAAVRRSVIGPTPRDECLASLNWRPRKSHSRRRSLPALLRSRQFWPHSGGAGRQPKTAMSRPWRREEILRPGKRDRKVLLSTGLPKFKLLSPRRLAGFG